MSGCFRFRSVRLAGAVGVLLSGWLVAQNGQYRRGASSATPAATGAGLSRTVSGRVLNGLTGAPVARALVNLNSRAVLTDAQGRFSFPAFTDANGYTRVTKPGYSASANPENSFQQRVTDLDAPIELKLYPDAILAGIVTGADGHPLSHIPVQLRRLSYDATGARWLESGFALTSTHGEYRFSTTGGRYRVSTGYNPRNAERGEAVLPVSFPPASETNTEYFELVTGDQRELNLRPRVGPAYPVLLHLGGGEFERGVRVTATSSSGNTFPLGTQRMGNEISTQLPVGSYLLRADAGERNEPLHGESRVTVTGRAPATAELNLTAEAAFPVEITADIQSTSKGTPSSATPSTQQMNLSLRNLANGGEGPQSDPRLNVRPDRSAEFHVPPGRYRLAQSLNGGWFVRSATNGVSDLFTEDLVVAAGAPGTPIRLVISNATGRINGTVTSAGVAATGWVYLIPQQPSLQAYDEIYIQSDGRFQWVGAPGKYIAVASAQQVHDDFRNSAFLRQFEAGGIPVEMAPGGTGSYDLTLATPGVAR